MSVTKFFVMKRVSGEDARPSWAPFEGASAFEHAYASFGFDTEEAASADMKNDADLLKQSVSRGEIEFFVKRGSLDVDGSIVFDDGAVLTADHIFHTFGLEMPSFSQSVSPRI